MERGRKLFGSTNRDEILKYVETSPVKLRKGSKNKIIRINLGMLKLKWYRM